MSKKLSMVEESQEQPTKADRAESLAIRCAMLELQLAEKSLQDMRAAYQKKIEEFSAKYQIDPNKDRINFETGEFTRG